MANEVKQYTGLQKVLRRIEAQGLIRKAGGGSITALDAPGALALALDVSRKTILQWLRADGVSLNEPVKVDNAVARAVQANGGPVAVAALLGVTYQAVTQWVNQGYVPNKRVPEFSIQFGVDRASILSPKVRSATGMGGEL